MKFVNLSVELTGVLLAAEGQLGFRQAWFGLLAFLVWFGVFGLGGGH